MKNFAALLLAVLPLTQALPAPQVVDVPAEDPDQARYNAFRVQANKNMRDILANRTSGCTLDNVIVRKEWTTLTLEERVGYTDAIRCLKAAPPITPLDVVPGVRSRFDDFQALHINQSSFVHWTVYFQPWHRYLMHSLETALRDECGYSGAHPYWDWSMNGGNITAQEMFSGAVGSLGGNGEYIPHGPVTVTIPASPPFTIQQPAGTGGGCIQDGPFKDFLSPLGPLGPPLSDTWAEYNPVCIERDFRPEALANGASYKIVADVLESPDLASAIDGMNTIHGAGHNSIGGSQSDLFVSNADPAFYLHHGGMDHVWAVWQALDFEARKTQVTGTLTLRNMPPSEDGTIDTPMDLGYLGGSLTAGELGSTIDGPMCYIYAA